MRDLRWLSLARGIATWKDYKGVCAVLTVHDRLVAVFQRPEAINNRTNREPKGTVYLWGCEDIEFELHGVERVVVTAPHRLTTDAVLDEVELGE